MIEKINYRDQVRILLLKKMRSGELNSGDSLSLAALARELDVSVTPIREALTQLQSLKIIKSIPNRGFIIPELNNTEAKELYELVATIESFIVNNSQYDKKDLLQLKKLQEHFINSPNGIERINADLEFHSFITSKYENSYMKKILLDAKIRTFFYEVKFMEQVIFNENSENHHEQIIQSLEENNIKKAAQLIVDNWMLILNYIKL